MSKPIFKEEQEFLQEYGINIPNNCWRDGSKIYLNSSDLFPIIKFKVDEITNKIKITQNNIISIEDNKVHIKAKFRGKKYDEIWINKTFEQEIEENTDRLDFLVNQSVEQTVEYLNSHLDYEKIMSISGGKDSSVQNYIYKKFIEPRLTDKTLKYLAFNTTNDTADTYRQMYYEGLDKSDIVNPLLTLTIVDDEGNKKRIKKHMGWYQWIEQVKGYWIPNALKRSCCSTFKEGQVKLIQDKNKKYVTMLGVRKYESAKRAFYEFDIRQAYNNTKDKNYNMPDNWERIAPICYWTDTEIWLYIIRENMIVNPMYYKGFNRCGCLVCPYNSDYTNLLIKKYYPLQWARWMNIVAKNYEVKNVAKRLKWTLEEYLGGKWKVGLSKEYELISKKKTKERVEELAKIKGISYEMAEKYWDKSCGVCGKAKLNPDEIAMFYKMYGRFEGKEDNRKPMCKNCLCEDLGITPKEYSLKVQEFRRQDCNLF